MNLVFIHGWGFTADFWNPLGDLLKEYTQQRVDMGFYGHPSAPQDFGSDAVLIGHSLGFMHGIAQKRDWKGLVALNGFTRFVHGADKPGCVTPAQLREIKFGMSFAAPLALQRFYGLIGAKAPDGAPDTDKLQVGLDELRDGDVAPELAALHTPGLVLASRNDPLVPAAASEELGGLAQKGGIAWHETGGHALPLVDAAWCADKIQDFLRKFCE